MSATVSFYNEHDNNSTRANTDPSTQNNTKYHKIQHNTHQTGEWRDALPVVEQSIQIDPNYQYAFGYRGLLKHTLGWPRLALDDLMAATNAQEKVDNVVAALAGVCHTCLGKYRGSTCVCILSIRSYYIILKESLSQIICS